jgi:hypothetical protein
MMMRKKNNEKKNSSLSTRSSPFFSHLTQQRIYPLSTEKYQLRDMNPRILAQASTIGFAAGFTLGCVGRYSYATQSYLCLNEHTLLVL